MIHPELLQSIPFLREVSPSLIAELAGRFEVRLHPKGTLLVEEGGEIGALHIICRGVVHARQRSGSKEVLLARIGVGGFFGEVNLFSEGKATASFHPIRRLSRLHGVPSVRRLPDRHPPDGRALPPTAPDQRQTRRKPFLESARLTRDRRLSRRNRRGRHAENQIPLGHRPVDDIRGDKGPATLG